MVFILFQILLMVTCCAWLIFLIVSKCYKKNISFSLSEVDYKLYYYKDLLKDKEYISKELKELLKIAPRNDEFLNLVNCVDQDSKKLLEEMHSKLNQSASSKKRIIIRDIDLAIKVKLNKDSNEQEVDYFSCQYLVLRNKEGFGKSFFIFFADITDDMREVELLQEQNENLKNIYYFTSYIKKNLPIPLWARDAKGKFIFENKFFSENILPKMSNSHFNSTSPINIQRNIYIDHQRRAFKLQEKYVKENNFFFGVGTDLTEKKNHQGEIRKYSVSLSKLLEASSNAVAIYGPDRKIQFYNKSFVELWPLDEKFLKTEPLYDDVVEYLMERKLFPDNLDYIHTKKERIKFFHDLLSSHNEFLFLPDGRTIRMVIVQHAFGGLIFVYEDMTDRYQLESSYKTLNAVQNKTINNINDGVAVFAANGKVVISNSKFLGIWNFNTFPNDTHYKGFFEKISPQLKEETSEKVLNKFLDSFNNRSINKITINTINNKTLKLMFIPLPDGATLLSVNDITDSALLERNLREKNKLLEHVDRLKTDFLNNISYELRSPLTSIIGFSEILKNQYYGKLNDKQVDCLAKIEESSDNLLAIINEILDLASIEAGYIKLKEEEVILNDLLKKVFAEKEFRLGTKEEFRIKADSEHLENAFQKIKNFLINNHKDKQEINISVEDKNRGCQIILNDIVLEDNSTIEIFRTKNDKIRSQIKPPFKSQLSIAKTIIELHGGEISAPTNSKLVIILPEKN